MNKLLSVVNRSLWAVFVRSFLKRAQETVHSICLAGVADTLLCNRHGLAGAVLMPLIGVVAIAEALQPVRSKDGSWVHNACVQRLGLNGAHM